MKVASTLSLPAAPPPTTPRSRGALFSGEPLILLALVLAGLYFARPVLIPLAMALTLNFLLTPLVVQIEKMGVKRIPAVLLVVAIAFTVVGGVGWIVARQVIAVINDLPNYRDNIHDKLTDLHAPANGRLTHTLNSIQELGQEISSEQNPTGASGEPQTRREREAARLEAEKQPVPVKIVPPAQTAGQYVTQYARPIMEPVAVMVMVVIFTFYMLVKREDLRNRLLLLAGKSQLNLMTQALNEAAARISRYLVTNVLVNASFGVIFGIGLYLLHVPNATLWGALAGILRMVPYAGTMIAGVSTLAFTVAVFHGWHQPLFVLLLFAGLEFVVAYFAEPLIYGKRTGISAFALVIMAIVWTLLWGWPGLIVSTPMTVCLIVMGRHVPQLSFLHILLGEDAALSPEAHFYERLLAMDQPEAHHIANRFLERRNLVELYDGVVLPALLLSEQDRHKGVLDEVHSEWLYQSATELIAELTDFHAMQSGGGEHAAETNGAVPPVSMEPAPEPEHGSPVICIPAGDRADEIVGTMLAQLLERHGHRTILMMAEALSPEIMERLSEDTSTIMCISAVPPFAFAQARKVALAVRANLPKNPIVIGLWGGDGDMDALRARFGNVRPNAIVTTLADAVARVTEIDKGVLGSRAVDTPVPGYTLF